MGEGNVLQCQAEALRIRRGLGKSTIDELVVQGWLHETQCSVDIWVIGGLGAINRPPGPHVLPLTIPAPQFYMLDNRKQISLTLDHPAEIRSFHRVSSQGCIMINISRGVMLRSWISCFHIACLENL